MMEREAGQDAARVRVRVRGQVQGVGFRPFVYQLAHELGLTGWVRNDGEGVEIEAQAAAATLARFLRRLRQAPPPLARVDEVEERPLPLASSSDGFIIVASQGGVTTTGVTTDAAVCRDCLAELFDPGDRRHRYPFINCTNCGPRYTITRQLPYDRPFTTMSPFEMCPRCQGEYDSPLDRRFHAQPNACPACGPRLELGDLAGDPVEGDPVAAAVQALGGGAIVAIKGLGGFHLACDARDGAAVARLRRRKHRDEKPLAVMVANLESLDLLVGEAGRELLSSTRAPIVLLRKRPGCDGALPGVAPGLAWLGVMLPYTPLHHLLFHEAAGRPEGAAWLGQPQPLVLVMTSANPGGEPLVTSNPEARQRLEGIADLVLAHDRDIHARCDDSVIRPGAGGTTVIRRGRGYTPRVIPLPRSGPSVLACGGWFKNTICLTRGDQAFLSGHIGDLDSAATCVAMEAAVEHLMDVLQIEPRRVAHDLHPDFFSTRFAARFAAERGLPRVPVQHHHAHAAAVAAEAGLDRPALALVMDGVGLGDDGAAWGGELLRIDGARFERLGHLAPLRLPGGDRAAREPWRMAASALHALGRAEEIEGRFPGPAAGAVVELLSRQVNAPMTTSAGRQFDAAAGLLGVRRRSAFDGQAAMLLEGLAERHGPADPLPGGYSLTAGGDLDLFPLLGALADEGDAGRGAARFHATLIRGLAAWVAAAAVGTGLRELVLAGGCFMNYILCTGLRAALEDAAAGVRVVEARSVPPNDGGLSIGQAWVALLAADQPEVTSCV